MAITERGQLVALLVPPQPADTARDQLLASGQLIAATRPFRAPHRVRALAGSSDTATVLGVLREDRL